jgi:homoserine O-succinyltransferase
MGALSREEHSKGVNRCMGSGERVSIAFVNNMPDAAIRSSERQFYGLLKAASGDLDVDVRRYTCPDVPRTEGAREAFLQHYSDIDELFDSPVDGLIVTGAEPRSASLTEEPFWPSLARLIDWADGNTISTIWSCLAAHAAVFRLSGVARRPMATKLSGLYECTKALDHPLTAGTPQSWRVPHSRCNDLPVAELNSEGFQPIVTIGAGIDTFISRRSSMFLFFQGHPEYDPESLLHEYLREVRRFMEGKIETYPNPPAGYFKDEELHELEDLRQKIVREPRRSHLTVLSQLLHRHEIRNTWRHPSIMIYRNWLQYIVGEKHKRIDMDVFQDEAVAA